MVDYSALRFVDQVGTNLGNNLLFRGPSPIDKDQNPWRFDPGLTQQLKSKYPYPPFPETYYLIVVSLLYDFGDDAKELAVERQYFANNPGTGQLVWWPTWGSVKCYYRTDPAEQDRLIRTFDEWLPDTLIRRTETLRYMLETSWAPGTTPYNPGYDNPPCVFYVHCDGGCDRTSEMIGAYRLRQGFSWQDMYDEHPCGPMGCNNYRALQWYAIWLNQMFGYGLTPYGDAGCSDPSPPAPVQGQPWQACAP